MRANALAMSRPFGNWCEQPARAWPVNGNGESRDCPTEVAMIAATRGFGEDSQGYRDKDPQDFRSLARSAILDLYLRCYTNDPHVDPLVKPPNT